MSDVTGSAVLAGNPASEPAAGATGGDATQNVVTGNLPEGSTSTPAADLNPSSGKWYDSVEDSDLKGYAELKGWKDPTEALNSYRNLEKLIGSEKVPMPKGADDAEGWNRVYDALGRPKTSEGYGLTAAEGGDPNLVKSASDKFYELGLTEKQGAELANWWAQQSKGIVEAQSQQAEQNFEKELGSLKSEWGDKYDENVEYGRRAAREYGLNQEKLTKLESALGTAEMLKLMASIGKGQGEAVFIDGDSGKGFGMSPAAAQSRIAALRADPGFAQKYLSGDADAKEEMARLSRLAYPE